MDTQLALASAVSVISDDFAAYLRTLTVEQLEDIYRDASYEAHQADRMLSEMGDNCPADQFLFIQAQAQTTEARRRLIFTILQGRYYSQPTILFNEHDPLAENIRTTNGSADEMDLISIEDAPIDCTPMGGW